MLRLVLPSTSMKSAIEGLYPSLTRPMSRSVSNFASSDTRRNVLGANRTMRLSLSIHEESFRRPEAQLRSSCCSSCPTALMKLRQIAQEEEEAKAKARE